MVSDQQVRLYLSEIMKGKTQKVAAAKADMSERTGRRYQKLAKLPSQVKAPHTWRTRRDPFEEVWDWVRGQLEVNPGLEAKTLFVALQRKYPGKFQDGQVRTLQRRVKMWRALEGPPKEVYFEQVHRPGELCQSDFTHMGASGVTLAGQRFPHALYHFVLTYSNWEAGSVCFSESFESLSQGLQNALWKLGGVPRGHQTDCLTAAVNRPSQRDRSAFTRSYEALLKYYGLTCKATQPSSPHENGDVEQRHHRFKRALEQKLLLRGSRDFESREKYEAFLEELFGELNEGRQERLKEELSVLRTLPPRRLEDYRRIRARVTRGSTIRAKHNVYSVPSRLIGEEVEVRIYMEVVEVWYAQRRVARMPRLRGDGNHRINYRHIIDWLVRKPGAFENYRYRQDLFPSSYFRAAYDWLETKNPARASREYLRILHLAAHESEADTNQALRFLIQNGRAISFEMVEALVKSSQRLPDPREVRIEPVNLASYDELLQTGEEE